MRCESVVIKIHVAAMYLSVQNINFVVFSWNLFLSFLVEAKKVKKLERMQAIQQARQAKRDQCMYDK